MKQKEILERLGMDVKRHIDYFAEIIPDEITGKRFAVVKKNIFGQIIKYYTTFYKPHELRIAVDNYINALFEAENRKEVRV